MSMEVSLLISVVEMGCNRDGHFIIFKAPAGDRIQIGVPKEFWDTLQPGNVLISILRKAE